MFASTPDPPYVAVIFTSVGRATDDPSYAEMAAAMEALAAVQPGYLGIESAREALGVTVSYWATEADAAAWKQVTEHRVAQARGRDEWYAAYRVRVAVVHREHGWGERHLMPGG